jgi:hypothetical protein
MIKELAWVEMGLERRVGAIPKTPQNQGWFQGLLCAVDLLLDTK